MIRQLNVKRQLTIPSPLAKRFGLGGKAWVDISEKNGALIITPVDFEGKQAEPLKLSNKEWKAFNRKVRAELAAGKGKTYPDARAFLSDLKRRMTDADR